MATLPNRGMFTKIKVARELLREEAENILKRYLEAVNRAEEQGEPEVAIKALQWLMEHMPADDDGGKLLEPGIDKQQPTVVGNTGPTIQIGIQVGGTTNKNLPKPKPKKALPAVKVETINADK